MSKTIPVAVVEGRHTRVGAIELRFNQRWELDSTKADLMLSDGQRHVIVGVIDVFTRRMKLLVSRTSSAAAVAALLRRTLLE